MENAILYSKNKGGEEVMKCKICGEREAEVRDRDDPTNPKKTICSKCHGKRLLGDIRGIMAAYRRKGR